MPTTHPPPRNAGLAALLSFFVPGLGQAYAGRRRAAVAFAAPVVLLVLGLLIARLLLIDHLRNDLLSATFLTAALLVNIGLMGWRLLAIIHAGLVARPSVLDRATPHRAMSIVLVAVLLATTVGMHAFAGSLLSSLNSTLADIFGGEVPGASGGPGPGPLNQPAYRWDGTERITFLLLGIDSGVGRQEANTDTILVVSVDPVARTAVMVSVPRDTGFVPLPDRSVYPDGVYQKKINELSTEASESPSRWCPDLPSGVTTACGLRTLERAIGLYLGVPIQFYATVDLQGFVDLIDAVGGVTLCLAGKMIDPEYGGPTWVGTGIELPAGCQQYDGVHALAYARIRKGWIELPDGTREQQNDFKRAERQQTLLLELRRQFAQADLIFGLPALLAATGRTVETDFPRSLAGDLASLLPLVAGPDIERVVLSWPDFVDLPTQPLVNYLLIPRRDDVRDEMERLFGPDLQGWYVGSTADGPPGGSSP
ncbi:MAG TPA: LCP family protein [Methylomirabilota bacterium]|nr:LCP family protein [Methylomirabilota bacterium]